MNFETIKNKILLRNEEKKFIQLNKKKFKISKKGKYIILEINNNYFTLVHYAYLLNDIKFKNNQFVGLWTPCIPREKGLLNLFKFFLKFLIFKIEKKKWDKLYSSIGIKKVVSINDNFKTNFLNYRDSFLKKNLKISSKKNYLNLKFKNILVGELMYDFYLRYFKKYTINFDDRYEIIKIANYVSSFVKNLNQLISDLGLKNIDKYIPWQAAYIQCGIPIRFFLNKKVKVIGKSQEVFSKKYTQRDFFQSMFFEDLKKNFAKFKNKKFKLKQSLNSLRSRYRGKINPELNYLLTSPFRKSNLKISKNIDVIIFLPDFVDAPHSSGGVFVFADFYDWIIETINFLNKFKNLNVAIKPHPNSRFTSRIFEEKLKKTYPNFIWLERTISNHSIFKKKPSVGISPRGSVLFDLAYHGICPVAIGRNPCMAYSFVKTAFTKKQYFSFMNKGIKKKLKLPKNYKKQVVECYFMNFINKPEYFETISSKINLKNYRNATTKENIHMVQMYNENYFKKN